MGCDIHPCIQISLLGDTFWRNVMVPDTERHYLFFGTLAGIRDDRLRLIVEQRGYPKNLGLQENQWTPPTDLVGWCDGEHSPSWFTLTEAKKYKAEYLNTLTSDVLLPLGIDSCSFEKLCEKWDSWIADMEYVKKFFWNPTTDHTDDHVRVIFNFTS